MLLALQVFDAACRIFSGGEAWFQDRLIVVRSWLRTADAVPKLKIEGLPVCQEGGNRYWHLDVETPAYLQSQYREDTGIGALQPFQKTRAAFSKPLRS